MKLKFATIYAVSAVLAFSSCKKYLDINQDPNNPDAVESALLLPPIQQNFAHGIHIDNRYIGRYVQHWHFGASANDQWDQHGFVVNTDRGGAMFRSVYWRGGLNLENMIQEAKANEKWDYVGVGYALKAYGWQTLTDIHGELIIKQAYDQSRSTFDYDDQQFIYEEVVKLCDTALSFLARTDGKVSESALGRGDLIFKGKKELWVKFVNGLLARNMIHLSKKSSLFDANKVIQWVDNSFSGNTEDALSPNNGTIAADASPFGPLRSAISGEEALHSMGQSGYAVQLMNGTLLGNTVIDPRMAVMLVASDDGTFRGLTPAAGQPTSIPAAQRVKSLYNTAMGTAPAATNLGKYLWRSNAPTPLMTYAELQFIKAEAAFLKDDKITAFNAYKNAVGASLDFVKTHAGVAGLDITATQRAAYLADPAIVPANEMGLTLAHIMVQKWIALYGWGSHEVWADMRKYEYDNTVYTGFTLPTLFNANNSKVVQRLRWRYNSEYVWNSESLNKLGALEADFHTVPLWFTKP